MEKIDDIIYFESDEEFTDFCVAPYAVIKQSKKGGYYVAGEYSDEYLKCVEMGKKFVIKDEDSMVFERQCVSKRVPVQDSHKKTLVQLSVENLEEYWEDIT